MTDPLRAMLDAALTLMTRVQIDMGSARAARITVFAGETQEHAIQAARQAHETLRATLPAAKAALDAPTKSAEGLCPICLATAVVCPMCEQYTPTAEYRALGEKLRPLQQEARYVRALLGLPEAAPFLAGHGDTLDGTLRVLLHRAAGYQRLLAETQQAPQPQSAPDAQLAEARRQRDAAALVVTRLRNTILNIQQEIAALKAGWDTIDVPPEATPSAP